MAGYLRYSQNVEWARGVEDLILEVRAAAAALVTIYIFNYHY